MGSSHSKPTMIAVILLSGLVACATAAPQAGLSAHAAAEAAVLARQQQYRNAYPSSAQGHAAAEAAVLGRQAQFANGGVVGASGNIGPSGRGGLSVCVAFRRCM